MKNILAILFYLTLGGDFILKKSTQISFQNNIVDYQKDPTYSETSDWILSKLKLYAKGYDKAYYRNSEFKDYYPNVRMSYDSFKIEYGKIIIVETYRYYGANLSEENNYKGFIIRQNLQEIPINDITSMNLSENNLDFCNLSFGTESNTIKFTRNLQKSIENFDSDLPKPIIEYEKKGGVYFRCDIESNLENRLIKALKHLKKLNLLRYPKREEKF